MIIAIFTVNFVLPSDLNGWFPGLNFSVSPITNDFLLAEDTEWRYNNSEFGRRPLTVNLMRWGHAVSGWSYNFLFLIVQGVAYVLTCLAILATAKKVSPAASIGNTVLPFCLLFPNVFLFVAHAHTYDDLFQYFFLMLVIFYLINRHWFLATFFLTGACIVRETSLLYIPAFIYLTLKFRIAGLMSTLAASMMIIVVSFATVILYSGGPLIEKSLAVNTSHRWQNFHVNFGTWQNFSETLTLILFVLGPFFYLCYRYGNTLLACQKKKVLLYSFLGLTVVNTSLVCITAYVREARLLVIPVLLILPVLPEIWTDATKKITNFIKTDFGLTDVVLILLGSGVFMSFYQPTVGGTGYAFKAYGVIWTCCMYLLVRSTSKCKSLAEGPTE